MSPSANGQSNLVVNGGFNTGTSGWTATNISGSGYVPAGGNPPGCFSLFSVSASAVPAVSQRLNGLTPGTLYIVSGDYRWGGKDFASNSFGVQLDGVYSFLAPTPGNYSWHSFELQYSAASTNTVLSISALDGANNPYYIDNIAVQRIPTLAIQPGGTNALLSWPTNGLQFSFQSATDLSAASWVVVTNTPAIVGTNYVVTVSPARQVQFFRLKR
jgi:hypothetical protein